MHLRNSLNKLKVVLCLIALFSNVISYGNSYHEIPQRTHLSHIVLHVTATVVSRGDKSAVSVSIENRGEEWVLIDDHPSLTWTKVIEVKPGEVVDAGLTHPISAILNFAQRRYVILPPLPPSRYEQKGRISGDILHFDVPLMKEAREDDRPGTKMQLSIFVFAGTNLSVSQYVADVALSLPLKSSDSCSNTFTVLDETGN